MKNIHNYQPNILIEDAHLIVVDKPAGMIVERNPWEFSLQDFVAEHCGHSIKIKSGPGVVHRLDKPTSGIVVMAKKASVLKKLNLDFSERNVGKVYVAEVEGIPEEEKKTLIHYLQKDDENRKSLVVKENTKGDVKAILHYHVLENRPQTTLLEIRLETGRYHQIRAQLAVIGHPIVGDPAYGSTMQSKRLHLHAMRLSFVHPLSGDRMEIVSKHEFKSEIK